MAMAITPDVDQAIIHRSDTIRPVIIIIAEARAGQDKLGPNDFMAPNKGIVTTNENFCLKKRFGIDRYSTDHQNGCYFCLPKGR